ncbi:MAG TPA: benzoate/H(+) symporter BenE family transporter [Burkholderiaceae bacterium]|nr:benzoate/H(+) symporter BenE family transporter [Burkholderiaceae bacterium]
MASDARSTDTARGTAVAVLVAGFVCVLVGFSSSYALIVQAGLAMGLDAAGLATMTAALSLGMGLTTLLPSAWLRIPVVTAWSTPGAALLAASLPGVPLPEAIGAFVACGALLTLAGATGLFERWMSRIPSSIASALLAGVLLRFGLEAFGALRTAPAVVGAMLATYLLARRASPRWAVPATLVAGVVAALAGPGLGDATVAAARPALAPLAWPPVFAVSSLLGVALPLFVVTMASQNLPGVAVLRASGYGDAPVSRLLVAVGLATLVLAPFGAFALNLAAITAALCMAPDVHPDPRRRWLAAAVAGTFYLAIAAFAGPIAQLFAALPREMVVALAGVALIPTIGRGLQAAVADEAEREPALVTFLVTASGLTLWGVGSAFWGTVFGVAALLAWRRRA